MTHRDDRLLRRARRLGLRPLYRLLHGRRVRVATARLAGAELTELATGPLAGDLTVVSTFRVDSDDRLRMLQASTRQVDAALGGCGLRVIVDDASPEEYAERTRSAWSGVRLDVEIRSCQQAMATSLAGLLRELDTRWFYLQFDDQVTVGLSPSLLSASRRLLQMCAGDVDVVFPSWPVSTHVDEQARQIRLVSHEVDEEQALYRFGPAGSPLHPVRTLEVEGYRFGIFENFTYGFFVNHLVADADDYRRRLEWYMRSVGTSSVHRIENAAASGLRGPAWKHVAVCLDGVALLDLDYAHTAEAVRGRSPQNEAHVARLENGWSCTAAPGRMAPPP